jgi:acyl phosphate:glycerol-3-phosphate acyltransferase
MNNVFPSLVAVLAAYLIGSLSFAVIVSRVAGLSDPRTYGSKNPGATNVLRSGSKLAAIATLVLDALKGFVPVVLANHLAGRFGWGEGTVAAVGFAAFIGHVWPVFFRFQGGKGVATAAGVLLGFSPWLGLGALASFVIITFFFRYASLASIVAAMFAPFFQLLVWGTGPIFVAVLLMAIVLVWRHGANVKRLMAGTESKLGSKGATGAPLTAQGKPLLAKHAKQHKHAKKS